MPFISIGFTRDCSQSPTPSAFTFSKDAKIPGIQRISSHKKMCIYYFFFLGACRALPQRSADHGCNVRTLQTLCLCRRYRQTAMLTVTDVKEDHQCPQFIKNYKRSYMAGSNCSSLIHRTGGGGGGGS